MYFLRGLKKNLNEKFTIIFLGPTTATSHFTISLMRLCLSLLVLLTLKITETGQLIIATMVPRSHCIQLKLVFEL
jgi:hypothetical protein